MNRANQSFDVLIVGGGAVGCAIARELARYRLSIALVEKEADVAAGTSGRNSGGMTGMTFMIIHSGRFSRVFWASRNASTICRRLSASVLRCLEVSCETLSRNL